MPRSGSGTYTLPSGNPVVTGTTIETTWANNTLSDVATAMTDSLSRSGQGGMTSAFRAVDGTSSVPGIAWSSETTTGLYRAGSADTRLVITTTEVQKWLTSGTAITGTLSATGNVLFDGGTFVFNESGADKDARFEGDTDANLLFTDASTDRVGVGTNAPTAKLNVEGSVIINDAGADVDVRIEGDTDANLFTTDASTDRVGIGTASPSEKLDVRGNLYLNNTNGYVYIDNGGAGGASLKLGVNGTSDAYIYAVESDPLIFGTGNTERFRIGSSGELGIGGANYGTSGQVLASQGSGAAPVWTNAATGDVTLTGTQTLTNKTIEAGTFTNGYTEETVTANTGTAYTIDLANGTVQILTLTGNCVFTFPTATAGKSFTLLLKQDATGSRTVTWPSVTNAVKWPSSTAPTITSTASKGDKYIFTADGTYWWGSNAGQNYL